jgi:hypothetical protein
MPFGKICLEIEAVQRAVFFAHQLLHSAAKEGLLIIHPSASSRSRDPLRLQSQTEASYCRAVAQRGMDAFESLIATLLRRSGYWIHPSFKVDLTKEEKRVIGRPSTPRWELDLVAYRARGNQLLVVECKSYLDSYGVFFKSFDGSDQKSALRFKLFNDAALRDVVFSRLVAQLEATGSCNPSPTVQLCLVAGRIASERDRMQLRQYFASKDWLLWDDEWLRAELLKASAAGYENDSHIVVAKLLTPRKAGLTSTAESVSIEPRFCRKSRA